MYIFTWQSLYRPCLESQNKEKTSSQTANLVGNHIHSPNILTEIQPKVTINEERALKFDKIVPNQQ